MSSHTLRSRPLPATHPQRHRWAWYCSCGWWQTGRRASSLALLHERHLGASR